MINQNESGHELKEENKEEDKEMNKEGGDKEMKNDINFMNEEQKDQEKKDYSLTDEEKARMQKVKVMYGAMPDSLVETKLIKKHP